MNNPRLAVLDVVGLCGSALGSETPRLNAFLAKGHRSFIRPAFPSVTCTAQTTYLTGKPATAHGAVANGWYNRELSEVQFWKQSNAVVSGTKVWESLRSALPGFTCAKLFWWYNMYSSADYSITPRPMYPADGRKVFDIYSWPYGIRPDIKRDLGEFPFPTFWGPAAGVQTPQGAPDGATAWIAESAKWIENQHRPTLSLVYLPHLDYNLQRWGPSDPRVADDYRRVDAIVGGLIDFYEARGVEVMILSEYGITDVDQPVHLNRVFRSKGWVTIKEELGLEVLDAGASEVFAVADHQVAHVYVKNPKNLDRVRETLLQIPGVDSVLDETGKQDWGIAHARAGDLVVIASPKAWFTYYFWDDDARAPDFARCVDIHRKPGYDPVELFLDPEIPAVKLKILYRLLQKRLGFRMLMDVIPLDARLVKGSHGRLPENRRDWPQLITSRPHEGARDGVIQAESVRDVIHDALAVVR